MTRETKVGLVVSCSFVCLVGTVVYVKYTTPDSPAMASYADQSGVPVAPADPTPVSSNNDMFALSTGPVEPVKASPVLTVPSHTQPMMDSNLQRAVTEANAPLSTPPAPTSPTFADSNPMPEPITPAVSGESNNEKNTPAPISWESPGTVKSDDAKTTPATFVPGPAEIKSDVTVTAPLPVTEGNAGSNSTLPDPPASSAPTRSETGATPGFQRAPEIEPPSAPVPTNDKSGNAPFPPPPLPDEIETKPAPVNPSPPNGAPRPQAPSIGDGRLAPVPAPASGPVSIPSTPSSSPSDPNVRLNPPIGSTARDIGAIPRSDQPVAGNLRPVPQVGTPVGAQTPPVAVPAPPSSAAGRSTSNFVPQVESYDEETYPLRTGDTLESVCQRYYSTDKYARALLLFNRNHPRPAPGLAAEPPQVLAGQPLYVPPPHILEKYYAYALPNPRIAPAVVVPAAGTSTGTSAPPASRAGERYVVRQAEMISTIARNTLGNLERWSEVYELNGRGFDPSRPLATGTVLAMPGDARIPETNLP